MCGFWGMSKTYPFSRQIDKHFDHPEQTMSTSLRLPAQSTSPDPPTSRPSRPWRRNLFLLATCLVKQIRRISCLAGFHWVSKRNIYFFFSYSRQFAQISGPNLFLFKIIAFSKKANPKNPLSTNYHESTRIPPAAGGETYFCWDNQQKYLHFLHSRRFADKTLILS